MKLEFSKDLPVDSYRHKGMRRRLVELLAAKGIKDEKVLMAFETLPRHFFLDKAFEEKAYQDKPLPIGSEQTISQPFTVAYQTQLLDVSPREMVLEVGTGSGFQAAILGLLGARVFTIERHQTLFEKSKNILAQLGLFNIRCKLGDGWKGMPEFAPFDKIIVTAGADELPVNLQKQLKIGGILVVPIGSPSQMMYKITRLSDQEFKTEKLHQFKFVPMLKGVVKG